MNIIPGPPIWTKANSPPAISNSVADAATVESNESVEEGVRSSVNNLSLVTFISCERAQTQQTPSMTKAREKKTNNQNKTMKLEVPSDLLEVAEKES